MEKMEDENIRQIIGKKVYIELNSGRKYTGIIKDVDRKESNTIFIYMNDKFDELVIFPISEIKFLEVEK